MTDPSAVAAYRQALRVAGVGVTVQRESGYAPNVVVVASANVTAAVRQVAPDGTSTSQAGIGAGVMGVVDQADRLVILLAADLAAQGFPLPVVKGDQVLLPDSAERLNVTRVDAYKRRLAGAIEIYAAGVS